MLPAVLRSLEFDRVVEMVRGFAMTPMGDDRLSRLAPSGDLQTVAQLLAATSETTKYLATHGLFPLRSAADIPQIVSALYLSRDLSDGRVKIQAAGQRSDFD